MPRPLGRYRDIVGLNCCDLTYDVSLQCRGCAGVLISHLNSRENRGGGGGGGFTVALFYAKGSLGKVSVCVQIL